MPDDNTRLLAGNVPEDSRPSYYSDADMGRTKTAQVIFVGTLILMVFVTISLSIYQGVHQQANGALYFMLGLSLIGFVVIELLMVNFIRKGDLSREKTWFLYFVGGCVFLEAIFTDVLLFR
ncbi:Hypothetical predicted protein [Octopus vulgaris]|uniref:Uncharacterized protein n=2 Tax=Octopus TaxID=6643 RepID=A0AA36AUX7_OCTVU|nr:uncharacterized protein LOC115211943 [Octopus sinensis]CAI9722746.1 Hypothetical predicted protein [Octopus vulgaris]